MSVTIPWSRYVAIGDSLTEGVGDPARGGLRGWADRLAQGLRALDPELRYWNLARRSLTTREVFENQLEPALELEPDLVSVVVGMNDVMTRVFDRDSFEEELERMVETLASRGSTVLVGTLPRDLPLLRVMPRPTARALRDRLETVGDVVLGIAARHDAVCIDAPPEWRYTMVECSIDGCHPNARGHAHIAELALIALAERAGIDEPAPGDLDARWLPSSLRHLRWLASEGYLQVPTVVRRLRQRMQPQ